MKRRIALLATAACLLMVTFAAAQQQERGPSTPEERQRAVQLARALEQNPTAKELQKEREWGIMWLIQIPDISVTLCTDTAPWIKSKKYKFGGELTAVQMLSSAAFIIEHPDAARDEIAVNRAGLESAVRAYQNLLQLDPKAQLKEMDAVVDAKRKGEIESYVRTAVAACNRSKKS